MEQKKSIALVSHDNCKQDLIESIEYSAFRPGEHKIICTGTAAKIPTFCNRSATNFFIPSNLFNEAYGQKGKDYYTYNNREVKL